MLLRTRVKRIVRMLPGGSSLLRTVGRLMPETGTPKELFTAFYRHNAWEHGESRSGSGSTLAATATLRRELPGLLRRLGVRSLLDVPCGDFHWMREVDLAGIDYIGGDIVDELVARNSEAYGALGRRFEVIDLTSTPLPRVDLVFCRDCLPHLPYRLIFAALANIKASGAHWAMLSNHPRALRNVDVRTGQFRPIDLRKPPFDLPEPVAVIEEDPQPGCERRGDKAMAVWRTSDLFGVGSQKPATGEARVG